MERSPKAWTQTDSAFHDWSPTLAGPTRRCPDWIFGIPLLATPLSLWIEEASALPHELVDVLVEIRRTLLEQPVRYIHNVGDDQSEIFSVLTTVGLSFSAGCDSHRKAALGCTGALKDATRWLNLVAAETGYVVLSARSYEEISALRFWLRDAIVIRWARESERFSQGRMAVPLRTFELELPDRDPERVRTLKALYTSLGFTHCLYTDSTLGRAWDLDHLLPWSRFPVNLFWNLVPASPRANRGQGGT